MPLIRAVRAWRALDGIGDSHLNRQRRAMNVGYPAWVVPPAQNRDGTPGYDYFGATLVCRNCLGWVA